MRTVFRWAGIAAVLLTFGFTTWSCSGNDDANAEFEAKKQDVRTQLQTALAEVNQNIEAATQSMQVDTAGVNREIDQQIMNLKEIKADLNVKLAELQQSTREEWSEFETEVDQLLEEVDRQVARLKSLADDAYSSDMSTPSGEA